jgi:hypothetical protein
MEEGTEEASESGVDLVLNHRLVETGFAKKNDYMAYLKDYMKKIVKYLEENNRAGEVDTFKKNINGVMKGLLGKLSDLQFYQGESMNPAAMVALIDYREIKHFVFEGLSVKRLIETRYKTLRYYKSVFGS